MPIMIFKKFWHEKVECSMVVQQPDAVKIREKWPILDTLDSLLYFYRTFRDGTVDTSQSETLLDRK